MTNPSLRRGDAFCSRWVREDALICLGTMPRTGPTVFFDVVECCYYSLLVERLLRRVSSDPTPVTILELGSGTGVPVARALAVATTRTAHVRGYEVDRPSFLEAGRTIRRWQVEALYQVVLGDFFTATAQQPDRCTVIMNPPYLPIPSKDPELGTLSGGVGSRDIVDLVLALRAERVIFVWPSFGDPVGLLRYATALGYGVRRIGAVRVQYGDYSLAPRVQENISALIGMERGFVGSDGTYYLFGIELHRKCEYSDTDALLDGFRQAVETTELPLTRAGGLVNGTDRVGWSRVVELIGQPT